jgi:hypothetical protein
MKTSNLLLLSIAIYGSYTYFIDSISLISYSKRMELASIKCPSIDIDSNNYTSPDKLPVNLLDPHHHQENKYLDHKRLVSLLSFQMGRYGLSDIITLLPTVPAALIGSVLGEPLDEVLMEMDMMDLLENAEALADECKKLVVAQAQVKTPTPSALVPSTDALTIETPASSGKQLEPVMVSIPAGTFTMGCQDGRDNVEGVDKCDKPETPDHEVTLYQW